MKNLHILSISFALIVLLVLGCNQQEPTDAQIDRLEVLNNLGPNGSNWAPANGISPQSHNLSLQTEDLNSLSVSAIDLVTKIIGTGSNAPIISNVTYSGANVAAGTFSLGGPIGLDSGIILSSGNIASVHGPNTSDSTSTNNSKPGDSDLDSISGFTTFDAAVLEFDFECQTQQVISFQYVFSSEEYNEYVNSGVNDSFGFFLNGANIALLFNPPNPTTQVSINTLNCGNPYNPSSVGTFCDKFINNDLQDGGPFIDTEMDGLTVVLDATGTVTSATVNHIKIAIADAGDSIFDSNVFIKAGSFSCAPPITQVDIDIKPGSDPSSVACKKPKGGVPVAIFGADNFDVSTIDLNTLQLDGVDVTEIHNKIHIEDKNGDEFPDAVLHLDAAGVCEATQDAPLKESVDATLTGSTTDEQAFEGTGDIRIVNR